MRYIWKGNISFGLINVPVGLFTAVRDHDLKFTLLHKKDLSEIRYARICVAEEKEVPYSEIIKGIEREGHYKILTSEDFKHAEGEKSKNIDIITFCDDDEIDSLYYEKPYFLKPEKNGEKAYFLLHQALMETGKVAVAHYVFKSHTHIAAIRPYKNILVLNQMRFHSQLVNTEDLNIKEDIKVSQKEVDMAKKLIEQLSGNFHADEYHDKYVESLNKTINKKPKNTKIKAGEQNQKPAKVYDIMSLLKASLEKEKPKGHKKQARR